MPDYDPRKLEQLREQLQQHGQEHLLQYWDELNETQRSQLLSDIEKLDLEVLDEQIQENVLSEQPFELPKDIQPAPCFPAEPDSERASQYAEAQKKGEALIRENKVAAFTVAGGQGTRLGFDGPKGAFPISPVRQAPLFQIFAEYIRGTNQRYGANLAWYIMTSPQNHQQTCYFFNENDYFGLSPERVRFFQQGVMPAFSQEGKILLDQKYRISFSPDGHGGSLLALRRSGALQEMANEGVQHINYIQVDNPLVKVVDPLFIGLHEITGSDMSSKTIPKVDDKEKVGNFAIGDGTTMVIEYSDLPDELAHTRDENGQRMFDNGSIAIHVLRRSFVERLTADPKKFALPWHRANKKVPHIDTDGHRAEPVSPNAIKLETFIFDAIPRAKNPLILETRRAEEFSPVKNATGKDSPETAQRDLSRRAARWLEYAGCEIPRNAHGEPDGIFEISPLAALDADHLRKTLTAAPKLVPGGTNLIGP